MKRLRLAIQKKGRLYDQSVDLLRSCGVSLELSSRQLVIQSSNFMIDVLFVRDDDIPEYVNNGVCDLGIVGQNIILETGKNDQLTEVRSLGFGQCRVSIAVPEKSEINYIEDLSGKKIATSYPRTLDVFLKSQNIESRVVKIEGSVEIAPSLNIADAIFDIVSTGSTLKANGMKELRKVLESQAVLIKKKGAMTADKESLLDSLLQRIDGSLAAKNSRYLMMNAPKDRIAEIKELIPGMEEPTVVPLTNERKVAIHAVAKEDVLWETVEQLKNLGATSILVAPIDKIVV